ncbi:hypothetical protein HMPREF0004_0495 [Achromobacter piechaudii ATCC 43553]|uniref:Uncharacterized protein n=1 Tax=Achromobacter piechaudii ATCC 43553 TaxID=742159 RepID=D4X4U8_9BURK|nr:hypothetical protein HMPREF0004_0495 [Achromobacter piechaudii ATCC 43553]
MHGDKGCLRSPCKIHATRAQPARSRGDRSAARGYAASLSVVCLRQSLVLFPKRPKFC